jgi:hypothetical protein
MVERRSDRRLAADLSMAAHRRRMEAEARRRERQARIFVAAAMLVLATLVGALMLRLP